MTDLISRAAAIGKVEKARKAARTLTGMDFVMMLKDQPSVDAVPIKPLSVWLAGYCAPPKYTVATNPVDSAKARADGWEQHIRNLIECGLIEEE